MTKDILRAAVHQFMVDEFTGPGDPNDVMKRWPEKVKLLNEFVDYLAEVVVQLEPQDK